MDTTSIKFLGSFTLDEESSHLSKWYFGTTPHFSRWFSHVVNMNPSKSNKAFLFLFPSFHGESCVVEYISSAQRSAPGNIKEFVVNNPPPIATQIHNPQRYFSYHTIFLRLHSFSTRMPLTCFFLSLICFFASSDVSIWNLQLMFLTTKRLLFENE